MNKSKRIQFRNQLSGNDCGIACLQMICQYFGKVYNVDTIKHYCHVSKLGISLNDIRKFLNLVGIESISANVLEEDLYDMPLPAILYYKRGHYVILEKVRKVKGKYFFYIVDPSFGRIKLTEEELFSKWKSGNSGIVIAVSPGVDYEKKQIREIPKEKNKKIIEKIKHILISRRSRLTSILFLTLLVLFTNWGMPLLLKENIDKGILAKDINIVWAILVGQFLFVISNLIANSFSGILTTKISLDINIDLNKTYFSKILSLPVSYFESKFKSDLIEGLNDQSRINNFISRNIIEIIITILNLIVFSVILILYNYKIFISFILFSIASVLVTLLFLKKKKILDYSLFGAESENRNNIYELIMGITEIKVNSAERNRINKWNESELKLKELNIRDSYVSFYMFNSNVFISKFRDIFLIGVCSFYVIENNMSLGTMMMISYVLGQLSGPIDDIIDFSQTIQRLNLSFDRLSGIYNKTEEVQEDKTYVTEIEGIDEITLANVSFKYNSNDTSDVLKNISLKIPTNKTTAIVGASGSGKSTLVKLILGFYFPSKGEIKLGKHKIQDISLKEWRGKSGVVMQDGYIFSGTIAENIAFSDTQIDKERLDNAIKTSELVDTINRLPMKINTQIGESGISLSGGEKQRIFLARAIYKNPNFMFFDEATSNLDTINERNIMSNLKDYLQDKTSIIIAHRLSTIRNADNIIVLKDGEIVDQGTHFELLQNQSEYCRLIENQLEYNG